MSFADWRDLAPSVVNLRSENSVIDTRILICVPKPRMAPFANSDCEKLWRKYLAVSIMEQMPILDYKTNAKCQSTDDKGPKPRRYSSFSPEDGILYSDDSDTESKFSSFSSVSSEEGEEEENEQEMKDDCEAKKPEQGRRRIKLVSQHGPVRITYKNGVPQPITDCASLYI